MSADPAPLPPPGFALIRVSDLAELLAHRPGSAPEMPAVAASPVESAMSAMVALLTARQTGADIAVSDVLGDADPARVVRLLVVMTSALLRESLADAGAELLRDLGEAAIGPGS